MIRRTLPAVLGICAVLAAACYAEAAETPEKKPAPEPLKIFSGRGRLIVVNGYSTSFHWWAMLQRKIDRHTGKKGDRRAVTVRPATRGGTPIARWMDVKTGQPLPAWTQTLRPALKAKGDRPAIVLAQQSLQWAFGRRTEGIGGPDDTKRIKQGAEALRKYAELLVKDGADLVFLGMHIYKKPMEPQIGNERLALAELIQSKPAKVHAGPDTWEPTKKHYPKAFAPDKLHPNSIGAEIMAQRWFETLLKHDGLEVPDWSRKEMEEALKKDPIDLRRGGFQRLLQEWQIRPPRPGPGRRKIPERLRKKYDTDGDGKLSPAERARMLRERRKRMQERRKAAIKDEQ